MICPKCKGNASTVTQTNTTIDAVYRYRACKLCFHNFKSKEDYFLGAIPSKRQKYMTPVQKEVQKNYDSSAMDRFWK